MAKSPTSSRSLAPMPPSWEPPADLRSAASEQLLAACEAWLTTQGLEADCSLTTHCRHRTTCWRAAVRPPEPVHRRLPWVGPEYAESRVLVVGMNAQTHGGLWDEAWSVHSACEQMALGRQRFHGAGTTASWFQYRSAIAAGLLLDLAGGATPTIRPPELARGALLRSARLQAVQCAPWEGTRRTPSRDMFRRCPEMLAWPMLRLLAPRFVALLGTDARVAFERSAKQKMKRLSPLLHFMWELGPAPMLVVALRHPSSGYGMQSLLELRAAIEGGELSAMNSIESPSSGASAERYV